MRLSDVVDAVHQKVRIRPIVCSSIAAVSMDSIEHRQSWERSSRQHVSHGSETARAPAKQRRAVEGAHHPRTSPRLPGSRDSRSCAYVSRCSCSASMLDSVFAWTCLIAVAAWIHAAECPDALQLVLSHCYLPWTASWHRPTEAVDRFTVSFIWFRILAPEVRFAVTLLNHCSNSS